VWELKDTKRQRNVAKMVGLVSGGKKNRTVKIVKDWMIEKKRIPENS